MTTEYITKYYLPTENFKLTNPNPEWGNKRGWRWDRGDCAIRALANSTGAEWITAYDYLSAKARRDFNVPNDMGGFRNWVVENGAVWNACKAVKGKKRMTVLDFAKSHKTGRYVVQIANHFTACVNGVILDAWNPFESAVVGYLDMEQFKY